MRRWRGCPDRNTRTTYSINKSAVITVTLNTLVWNHPPPLSALNSTAPWILGGQGTPLPPLCTHILDTQHSKCFEQKRRNRIGKVFKREQRDCSQAKAQSGVLLTLEWRTVHIFVPPQSQPLYTHIFLSVAT